MKDTFVWWLLIESFVLLVDKILRNGIARSTLCFFFFHGCNFLQAVTVTFFFSCFCAVCSKTWNNGIDS